MTARRGARPACVGALIGLAVVMLSTVPPASAGQGRLDKPPIARSRYVPPGSHDGGLLSMPIHADAEATLSAVVLLADGGADGRTELYALRLLSLGFAVLEAEDDGSGWSDGSDRQPHGIPAEQRLAASLAALRGVPQIAPTGVGVIGFGSGAHAMLASMASWRGTVTAAVLVYPACATALANAQPDVPLADAPPAPRLLLVHGDADPAEAAACAQLAAALGGAQSGVERYVLRGAGFGWDITAFGRNGQSLLPDPARSGTRRRAVPDPERTLIALDQILLFLGRALDRRTAAQ